MQVLAEAPNVADWIAAIGQAAGALFTAAAVAIAVWLGWRDRKWRRADRVAAAAERDDRDAAQARLITITSEFTADETVRITIRNESGSPIFDVDNDDIENDGLVGPWDWRYDMTGLDEVPGGQLIHAAVLSSGETLYNAGIFVRDDETKCEMAPWDRIHATVTFTDANGLRWSRRDTEAPIRIIYP